VRSQSRTRRRPRLPRYYSRACSSFRRSLRASFPSTEAPAAPGLNWRTALQSSARFLRSLTTRWRVQTSSHSNSASSRREASSEGTAGRSQAPGIPHLSPPFCTPRPSWDQGDIVESVYFPGPDSRLPAVLVTPACDLEQEKVSLWTFVALFPDIAIAKEVAKREKGSLLVDDSGLVSLQSGKQRAHLERKLQELMKQRFSRYHWLPITIGKEDGHVVDFSVVTSLPSEEVHTRAVRIASMNSSWREELPARFAAYIGRVGVDEYPPEESARHLERLVGGIVVKDR